jgi:hypothetical protein
MKRMSVGTRVFFSVTLLLVCIMLSVTLASSANAVATYSYEGDPFVSFNGTATNPPWTHISGYFTTNTPLAANLLFSIPPYTSYSFTNGVFTLTDANSTLIDLYVVTNSLGEIDAWVIDLLLQNLTASYTISTSPLGDVSASASLNGEAGEAISLSSGTWTATVDNIPEPSTCLLLGAGLAGVGLFRKRFKN